MAAHEQGSYVTASVVDGVQRIFTYAHVPGTPLIAVVAPAVTDVLAEWRKRSLIAGGLTLALGGVFVVLSWLLAFTLQDKMRAQAELVRLAATDPLTGLSNRRILDTRLDEEWRRARRNGSPMSVLFVDVDISSGLTIPTVTPRATRCWRRCPSASTRPCDARSIWSRGMAARSLRWCCPIPRRRGVDVAEKIRRKVQGMHLEHGNSDHGTVTVSVGCATCLPSRGGSALGLMAAADQQLYAAKSAGRNQVKSAA